MQRYKKESPSYLIALVGGAGPGEPLMGYDDLLRDARISRAMKAPEIVVYQLNLALEEFGHDFVRRVSEDVNNIPDDMKIRIDFSRPVSGLVFAVLTADAIMDIRSWKVIFLLLWIVISAFLLKRKKMTLN